MAGIKGKSGPPGNLNGARLPWRAYWRRRALKPEDRWVLPFVEPYQAQLLSDKPDATAGERRMIEICSAARVCWMIAVTRGDWKAAATFMTTEVRSLTAIGLDRRAKDVPALASYLAEKGEKLEPEGKLEDKETS